MPRKKGSQRSKFGDWIDRVLKDINEGNKLVLSRILVAEAYTQEMLADAANIERALMSRYCSADPNTNIPRLLPPRHAVMKIVAVLGVAPEEAKEALQLTGYCVERKDSVPHFAFYQEILGISNCKPWGKQDLDAVKDEINDLLIKAAQGEQGYRGDPVINNVFVRL